MHRRPLGVWGRRSGPTPGPEPGRPCWVRRENPAALRHNPRGQPPKPRADPTTKARPERQPPPNRHRHVPRNHPRRRARAAARPRRARRAVPQQQGRRAAALRAVHARRQAARGRVRRLRGRRQRHRPRRGALRRNGDGEDLPRRVRQHDVLDGLRERGHLVLGRPHRRLRFRDARVHRGPQRLAVAEPERRRPRALQPARPGAVLRQGRLGSVVYPRRGVHQVGAQGGGLQRDPLQGVCRRRPRCRRHRRRRLPVGDLLHGQLLPRRLVGRRPRRALGPLRAHRRRRLEPLRRLGVQDRLQGRQGDQGRQGRRPRQDQGGRDQDGRDKVPRQGDQVGQVRQGQGHQQGLCHPGRQEGALRGRTLDGRGRYPDPKAYLFVVWTCHL